MKQSVPSNAQTSFEQKLKAYSAIGAAFLAAAPSAEASIVYHDPPDVTISVSFTTSNFFTIYGSASSNIFLDINGNSFKTASSPGVDVEFLVTAYGSYGTYGRCMAIAGGKNGGVVAKQFISASVGNGTTYANYYPAQLASGIPVNASLTFGTGVSVLGISYGNLGSYIANWGVWKPSPQNGYIGMQFDIGGNTHYGWIRIEVSYNWTNPHSSQVTIMDFAYEDVPNAPIQTGATASPTTAVPTMSEWGLINLGLLLLTMGTLFIRRIRETLGLQVEEVKES